MRSILLFFLLSCLVCAAAQSRRQTLASGKPTTPMDFGADPTGAADSSAAFNAAGAASLEVYVPSGTYNVSGIVLRFGAHWYGGSGGANGSGAATTLVTTNGSLFVTKSNVGSIKITDMELYSHTGGSHLIEATNDIIMMTLNHVSFYYDAANVSALRVRCAEIDNCRIANFNANVGSMTLPIFDIISQFATGNSFADGVITTDSATTKPAISLETTSYWGGNANSFKNIVFENSLSGGAIRLLSQANTLIEGIVTVPESVDNTKTNSQIYLGKAALSSVPCRGTVILSSWLGNAGTNQPSIWIDNTSDQVIIKSGYVPYIRGNGSWVDGSDFDTFNVPNPKLENVSLGRSNLHTQILIVTNTLFQTWLSVAYDTELSRMVFDGNAVNHFTQTIDCDSDINALGSVSAVTLSAEATTIGTITLTNAPILKTTNAAPAGFVIGVTVPVVWFAVTNAGNKYLIPSYAP